MTTQTRDPARTSTDRRTRRLRIFAAAVAVAGIAALLLLIWYILFRPAGPPPVGPEAPVIPDGAGVLELIASAMTLLA